MFSGKTEELLRRLRRAEIAGDNVTVFTPQRDDRYGTRVVGSHAGREWEATVVEDAEEILSEVSSTDIVAVDEANFFDQTLVSVCQSLADDGHRVIVSGTDQTFRGEPFSPLPALVTVAERVEKRNAVCACCGDPASRNQRLIDGSPAPADAPTIQVGGEESYEARCRNCHTVPQSDESV